MRIGILTHNYPANSLERKDAGTFVRDFAFELKKQKNEVFVFTPNFVGKKEKYKDIPVTWFKWFGGNKKLGDLALTNPLNLILLSVMTLKGSWDVINFVNKNNIDVTISMWAYPAGFWGYIAKLIRGKKSIVISMGSDIFVYPKILPIKWLISFILKNSTYLFGNSYKICDAMYKLSGNKATFIALTTNLSFKNIKPKIFSKNLFNFLFVGRLEKVKGPDVLIEAANIVNKKFDKFSITMIGPGTMQNYLQQKINEYKLDNKIKLLGPIYDTKELASYFLGADSLVIPSRSESFPFVLIEAFNACLPAVTTTVGDMGMVIPKNKIGYAVEPTKPKKLAEAMMKAMKEGKNFKKLRRVRLQSLAKEFSMSNSVKLLLNEIN